MMLKLLVLQKQNKRVAEFSALFYFTQKVPLIISGTFCVVIYVFFCLPALRFVFVWPVFDKFFEV